MVSDDVLRYLMGYFSNKETEMKSLPGPLFSVKKESKFPFCDSKWK
jgi:hypothetical protein